VRHRCQYLDQNGAVSRDALAFLGPIASVTVSRPVLRPEDIQQTSSIQIKMLVDTGASKTVIDRGIAESLGLEPIRFEPMTGISHIPEECPVFLLSLAIGFVDGNKTTVMTFTSEMIGMSTPPTPRPFNGLLGRDFFRFVHLSYDGPAGYCDIVGNSPDKTSLYSHGSHTENKDKRKLQRAARKRNRR
jgi:predicted aspartyl protease